MEELNISPETKNMTFNVEEIYVRPIYANGNAKFKSFFQIYRFKKTAENFLVPPLRGKKRKMFDF